MYASDLIAVGLFHGVIALRVSQIFQRRNDVRKVNEIHRAENITVA